MAIKSLISQARQIKASEGYQDLNFVDGLQGARELAGDVHSAAVAEGTTYLEEDINHLRTQIKEIVGKNFWYDAASKSLEELAGSARNIIQPVQIAGGITFAAGTADSGLTSGTAADETGTTEGFVFGAAATDGKHRVILRDKVTNMPIVDADENVVFGLMEAGTATDGSDLSASTLNIVTYTDVDGTLTPYAYDGEAEVVIPQRIAFGDANEDFAMINAGFANSVGSIELGDRQWVALDPATGSYTIAIENGDNADLGIVTNDSLTKVINALIAKSSTAEDQSTAAKGLLGYTQGTDGLMDTDLETEWDGDGVSTNYIDYDGGAGTTTVLGALKVLDNTLKTVEDLAKSAGANKQVEILAADLAEATEWTIPNGVLVQLDDKDAIDVTVNGQRLSSDKQVSGTAGDGSGDYTVSSNGGITFNWPLLAGDVIAVDVFKEA
jgi:hypothetical protein